MKRPAFELETKLECARETYASRGDDGAFSSQLGVLITVFIEVTIVLTAPVWLIIV